MKANEINATTVETTTSTSSTAVQPSINRTHQKVTTSTKRRIEWKHFWHFSPIQADKHSCPANITFRSFSFFFLRFFAQTHSHKTETSKWILNLYRLSNQSSSVICYHCLQESKIEITLWEWFWTSVYLIRSYVSKRSRDSNNVIFEIISYVRHACAFLWFHLFDPCHLSTYIIYICVNYWRARAYVLEYIAWAPLWSLYHSTQNTV